MRRTGGLAENRENFLRVSSGRTDPAESGPAAKKHMRFFFKSRSHTNVTYTADSRFNAGSGITALDL